MNQIKHIIEPERLLLVWQSDNPENRTRRTVGELVKISESIEFRHLNGMSFGHLLANNRIVKSSIDRINGRRECSGVMLFVEVRKLAA